MSTSIDRREFLSALGLGALANGPSSGSGAEPVEGGGGMRLWINDGLAAAKGKPWRKIHLDFHNSQHQPKIGEKFDAGEFGDRLLAGNVNAVVVFAKDMHGYFYYPSKYGPVHPGLSFDLLGEQVKACRERKIQVLAYYCTTWDHHMANAHPEWLLIRRDGSNYLPKKGQTPGWTALCPANEDFVRTMCDHATEFLSRYELDGTFFDMSEPKDAECFCPECLRQLKARGADPKDAAAQRAHKHELHLALLKRLHAASKAARPGCQVDFNNIGLSRVSDRVPYLDNVDVEALPTGGWGYWYFPLQGRYNRAFGVTTYGMTGRFNTAWADFGGLKLPQQLDAELGSIIGLGCRCDVGDQMPPTCRLDPAVYHVIGKSFGRIKQLEPYLEGAAPVAEAAMLIGSEPLRLLKDESLYGIAKLMIESRLQFDVMEPEGAWERYGLVVIPDGLRVGPDIAGRLSKFIEGGGAVIACHEGGLLAGEEKSWLEPVGLTYGGMSPFKPAYMIPEENFTGEIPKYEYALYEGASQWRIGGPARMVARLGEPLFQRSAEHFTSHRQSPFDHATDYAAVAVSGRVGLFGFPLGGSYFSQGYWVYREAFRHVLDAVLPSRVVWTDAPLSTEVSVTRQARGEGRPERWLVHVINFSATRGTPKHPVLHEDPIPLADVTIQLRAPAKFSVSRAIVAGKTLPVRAVAGGGAEVTVPRVPIHEIVSFEVG
ncbi:MAG TPA: hypothetical protein PLU30_08410 [Verrucomicrobiae bacterium]|nr:hypothetical protein [Verrucomicrobiae bacterium]